MHDIANEWLKSNDAMYRRRHRLRCPYLSERQLDEISKKEIPISSLCSNYIKARFDYSERDVMEIQDLLS